LNWALNWVDRLNAKIIARIKPGDRTVQITTDGFTICVRQTTTVYRFADMTKAYLRQHDIYVGTEITLWLGFEGASVCEISESDKAWQPLIAALDASGRLVEPFSQSLVKLMAEGADAPPLPLGLR
jgi:hypothetical protein